MGKTVDKLTVRQLKKLGDGKHSDGKGLYLHVRGNSRLWVYRYTDDAKRRREMSLGSLETLGLADARAKRGKLAVARSEGKNPIRRADDDDPTLAAIFNETYEKKRRTLRSRWRGPVDVHVLPVLGHRNVKELTAGDVYDALSPIWHVKAPTAKKALDRLGVALAHAAAKYKNEVDREIVEDAKTLLGAQVHEVSHIPAMPWREVPAFYASLQDTTTSQAMRLLILTAARTSMVRLARVEQFDGGTWTVPAANMKTRKEFNIPLSGEAQRVVAEMMPRARGGYLFSTREDRPLNQMTMHRMMVKRGLPFRPHGFRASFRIWAEETGQDWTLAEMSLDHAIGNRVERTYKRSDLLEQRRPLMQLWSDHVSS